MKTPFQLHRLRRLPRGKAWLVAAVVALVAAGVAIAGPGGGTTTLVTGTVFSTGAPTNSHTDTCTGATGTDSFTKTDAWYTGTSSGSSDTHLNGAITLHVKTVFDTTKNLGWVKGDVKIDSSTAGQHAHGHLTAVLNGSALEGFLTGDEQGPPGNDLLANVNAVFTSTGGFSSGAIGNGGGTNTAIVVSGDCKPAKPDHPKPDKHH